MLAEGKPRSTSRLVLGEIAPLLARRMIEAAPDKKPEYWLGRAAVASRDLAVSYSDRISSLAKKLRDGYDHGDVSRKEAARELEEAILSQHGKLKTLLDTHAMAAGMSRLWRATQKDPRVWGYEYLTVGDEKVRDEHQELEGIVLPKDHEFWETWWPPNGWNCRCRVRILYRKPDDFEEIDTSEIDASPDKGFDSVLYE